MHPLEVVVARHQGAGGGDGVEEGGRGRKQAGRAGGGGPRPQVPQLDQPPGHALLFSLPQHRPQLAGGVVKGGPRAGVEVQVAEDGEAERDVRRIQGRHGAGGGAWVP